jgi:hypothetical protein
MVDRPVRLLALAGSTAVALALAGSVATAPALPPLLGDPTTLAAGDFDGDGLDDLAVGSPFEDVAGERNAGVVNVLYGSSGGGLTAGDDQLWHQGSPGIPGALERDDRFGWSLTVGNFNGDGYDDLAIGIPYESYMVDAKGIVIFGRSAPPDWRVEAGAAVVLYGGPAGLSSKGSKILHQERSGVKGKGQLEDHFGAALAAGDFDGDGRDELAVGVPGEDRVGAVQVFFGSAGGVSDRDQLWFQKTPGVEDESEHGDGFGSSLAAGNYGYSTREDDLAVGIPGEDIGSRSDAGAVQIVYGQPGKGLDATGVPDLFLHQDAADVDDTAEAGDLFGWALAAADFGRSAQLDLAIGVPGEAVSRPRQGAVHVLYGGSFGISADADQLWSAGVAGLKAAPQADAELGRSLAAGDLNGFSQADLAVGAPFANGPGAAAGAVHVVHGGPAGLMTTGSVAVAAQLWTRSALGAVTASGDAFGFALAAGQFGKGPGADLAVGAPGADRPPDANTGDVHVLYGSATGVSTAGAQLWNQDSPGVEDGAEPGDAFGGIPVSLRGRR